MFEEKRRIFSDLKKKSLKNRKQIDRSPFFLDNLRAVSISLLWLRKKIVKFTYTNI